MAKKIFSFDQVIGHQSLITFLKKAIEQDNIPQVVLFHGNSGLGKSSIAKLLAIEVATRFEDKELRESYRTSIIKENQSTDSIKLFNMSEIQEKEEEIQRVKSELSLGFSQTGRKVLILDEAQNITKKAQDSLLTDLEHLPEGIYVFVCTTEIGAFTEAFLSRLQARFPLRDLSQLECQRLIRENIIERRLSFSNMNMDTVIVMINDWANNQPRSALNLLENFKEGSTVTDKDLSVFFETHGSAVAIELVKYLYGSMSLGIDYINSIQMDNTFIRSLVEVTKVAMGYKSTMVSVTDTRYLTDFFKDKNVNHLIQFTAEVTGLSTLHKRRVISAFMKAHVSYQKSVPPKRDINETFRDKDISSVSENVSVLDTIVHKIAPAVPSLEDLFAQGELLEK